MPSIKGKIINIDDYGKIMKDMLNIAKESDNHTWFLETDDFDNFTYTQDDLNELFKDCLTLKEKGVDNVDSIIELYDNWKNAKECGEPVATFYGEFLDIFDEEHRLDRLLVEAFENEDNQNHYESGKYVVAFEDRACEILFFVYEDGIPVLQGNTLDKEIEFCINDVDFNKYIRAFRQFELENYNFTFIGEIYNKYRDSDSEISEGLVNEL